MNRAERRAYARAKVHRSKGRDPQAQRRTVARALRTVEVADEIREADPEPGITRRRSGLLAVRHGIIRTGRPT